MNAEVRWGARIGFVDGEAMVGADAIMPLGGSFYFNPGLEVSGYGITANADAHYDVELTIDAAVWLGAGAALINPDGQDLDVGVNLLAGIGTRSAGRIFYSQLKVTAPASGGNFSALAVGMRF